MTEVWICPYCSKDRNDAVARKMARSLVGEYHLVSELCDPVGRALKFRMPDGQLKSFHISDQCNWCDLEKLKSELLYTHRRTDVELDVIE